MAHPAKVCIPFSCPWSFLTSAFISRASCTVLPRQGARPGLLSTAACKGMSQLSCSHDLGTSSYARHRQLRGTGRAFGDVLHHHRADKGWSQLTSVPATRTNSSVLPRHGGTKISHMLQPVRGRDGSAQSLEINVSQAEAQSMDIHIAFGSNMSQGYEDINIDPCSCVATNPGMALSSSMS